MAFSAIRRGFACVLLTASVAVGQQPSPASQPVPPLPVLVETELPEAPSAARRPGQVSGQPSKFPAAGQPALSPAERPFVPLRGREKFDHFVRSLSSPFTIAGFVLDGTMEHAEGASPRYGGGAEGWGKRMGAAAAGTVSSRFFGKFLFPSLLGQDARYFEMRHGPIWKRAVHAASRTVITRGDNGERQINYSGFLAIAASKSIENVWLPSNERGASETFRRMAGALPGAASNFLLREFAPDLLRFVRAHVPKPLRKVQDKIPQQFMPGSTPSDEDD